jgi:hypothetical protein
MHNVTTQVPHAGELRSLMDILGFVPDLGFLVTQTAGRIVQRITDAGLDYAADRCRRHVKTDPGVASEF